MCKIYYEREYKMKRNIKINYLNEIRKNINSLTIDQLNILFEVYFNLNYYCNFFMSEKTHTNFINLFIENPSNRNPYTFKSLMTLLTTQYTSEIRYPQVLDIIDMIHKNYSIKKIINILYHNR